METSHPTAKPVPPEDIEAIGMVLQAAIADSQHEMREAAAICLCNAPEPSPSVSAAIAIGLRSDDNIVLWYLRQLNRRKFPFPDPGPYIPNLLRHLKSREFNSSYSARQLIEHFGKQLVPYTQIIVDALADVPEDNKWRLLLALAETGISEEAANRLMQCVENDTAQTKAAAFVALLSFPGKATQFLWEHLELGEELAAFDDNWCEILYSKVPELQELRAVLITTPDLRPTSLALIGSPSSIPELTRKVEEADNHCQTRLHACIRACGGDLGKVVHLSQAVPVSFKPASAWPGTDARRRSDKLGHGDGFTEILITGELRFADGRHPAEVQFLRTNDVMLLGESLPEPMPVKYEEATGRFVFRTAVFAAYDVGKPPEPGPYQTGSAQVRIESRGCQPLVVQFFDEMPHVVIELQRE